MANRSRVRRYLVYAVIIVIMVSPFPWDRFQLQLKMNDGRQVEADFRSAVAKDSRFAGSNCWMSTGGNVEIEMVLQSDADLPIAAAMVGKIVKIYPRASVVARVKSSGLKGLVDFRTGNPTVSVIKLDSDPTTQP